MEDQQPPSSSSEKVAPSNANAAAPNESGRQPNSAIEAASSSDSQYVSDEDLDNQQWAKHDRDMERQNNAR